MLRAVPHPILRPVVLALAALLLLGASPALAVEPPQDEGGFVLLQPSEFERGFGIGFDVVVLRPMRLAMLLNGAVGFTVAALLTSPGGQPAISTAYEVFIETPWVALVHRELGDF